MEALDRAIAQFGTQTNLAKHIGVTTMAVSLWRKRGVPAQRVLAIEAATGHQVSRHELRPDLYPKEPWCRCPACQREAGEEGGHAA